MNNVSLIARLVHDPELRFTAKGTAVANLRVARNEKHGETERALFVDVTAWGKLAETVAEHKKQGDQIAISGRLEYSDYTDAQGNKRSKLSIVADSIEFLARKQNGAVTEDAAHTTASPTAAPATPVRKPASAKPRVVEEEIPF